MSFRLLLKCYSFKFHPPAQKQNRQLKNGLGIREQLIFVLAPRFRLSVILQYKGTPEPEVRLSDSCLLLLHFSPLHDNSLPQEHQDCKRPKIYRSGPAMNCFPWARLSGFIQLSEGRGTTENWTADYHQLFNVNRAKKLPNNLGFPGFSSPSFLSCFKTQHKGNVLLDVSSHSERCVSLQGYGPGLLMSCIWKWALLAFATNLAPEKPKSKWILRLQCGSATIRRGQTAPAALPASTLM